MSFSVPTWIERLLGIETGQGEGTVWSLEHTWAWAPWITLLFAAFAVVFVVGIYLRENREASRAYRITLALIRLALVTLVLLMLAQYALSFQRTGLPYVVVLVDDSLSMTTVDRYDEDLRQKIAARVERAGLEGLSRWNLARTLLVERDGALPRAIRESYKLRLYFVTGARSSPTEGLAGLVEEVKAIDPSGEATRLGTAVRAILDDLRGTAPAAIVILSDGINTDGPDLSEAAAYARRKGVPLFTVGLGDDEPVRDLELSDLLVEDVVFAGDVVNFEFQLKGTGFAGRKVEIVLRDRDRPGVLARMDATIEDQPQRLRLPYRPPEVGKFRYLLEVETLDGELDGENNRQERTVTVSDQKVRVLLVQGYPSYEYRYLANMLHRDGSIELNTVLQSADPEHVEQSETALRGFPVRRDELFEYNVIILGDADPSQLSASMMQNLVDFVYNQEGAGKQGRGGALVCLAGPEYMPLAYRGTPLAKLLPIELGSVVSDGPGGAAPEEFVLQPTELGLASPPMQLGDTPAETRKIWRNLPPLYWLLKAPGVKPGAIVLAQHPEFVGHDGRPLPLICMQYVGAGKVLFHATDETWRWRWRVGDVFFARYWVQTIRFLSRAKLSEGDLSAVLTSDRRKYQRDEPVQLRVRFADERLAPAADDGVTVVLEQKGRKTRRLQLHRSAVARGIFEGRLTKPPIGSYHAWVAIPTLKGGTPSVDFEVVAPPGEFRRVQMDAPELKRAAHGTRGRFYTFLQADRLPNDLPAGRQVPIESLPPKPLWNTWPVLLVFLLLLTTEWVLRKFGGMV
ncbi:MAG TPA: vWA domain-containing protein [Thermoguttaceae bacterium]|nr:vWA domain-containing protein [Thermoguttaceae bacterium]